MAIDILDCSISSGKANEYGVYNIKNLTVKYKKEILEFGKDYYTKIEPYISGNYVMSRVTVYGMNDYCGNTTVEFKTDIILLDINNYNFSINKQTYHGKEFIPEIITELQINEDFRVAECIDNKDVGEACLTLSGIGRYTGELIMNFEILPLHISTCKFVILATYDGNFDSSDIKVVKDDFILEEGIDYKLDFEKQTIQDAIICNATITGINNCIGTVEQTISLNGKFADIDKEDITLDSTEYQYTGDEIIPTVESKDLVEGVDYIVEVDNNIDVGPASVVLRGMGAFENSLSTKGFTITAIDIAGANITCGEPVTHILDDGSECDIYNIDNLKVEYNSTILIRDTDYNIRIEPIKDMTRMVLQSKITITGKGNYTGTKTQTFDTGIINKEKPVPQNPQYPEQLVAGLPVEIEKAPVYSQFFSRKYNALISGIVYIYSGNIRNDRIKITHSPDGINKNGYDGGWISVDDILIKPYKFEIGEKVTVNGRLYQNPDGTGSYIAKEDAVMYVVEILDNAEYSHNYGIASTTYNNKQGWCSENDLEKAL